MPFYMQYARLYVDTQRMTYRPPQLPVRRTGFHLRSMNETCMPRDQIRFEQGGDERTIFVSFSGKSHDPRMALPAYTRSDHPPYDRASQWRGYLCHLCRVDLARLFPQAVLAQLVLDRSKAAVDMRIALRLSAFRMSRPRLRRSTRVPEQYMS